MVIKLVESQSFTGSITPLYSPRQIFVTRTLTRDLFAVANLFTLRAKLRSVGVIVIVPVCLCVCLFVGTALLQPARSVCVASERFFIVYL